MRAEHIPELRILVWLAIALAAVGLITLGAPLVASYADLATIFFLSWLLAFLVRPLALRVSRLFGNLRYGAAVGLSYVIVGLASAFVIAVVGASLVQSITDLASNQLSFADLVVARLAPLQAQLDASGLSWIKPADWVQGALQAVDLGSPASLNSLGGIVVSLATALGTLAIVVFMSVYIAADRDRLVSEIERVAPARYVPTLQIAQQHIGHSFDGFVRGQVLMGIMYGFVAFVISVVLGIPYAPLVGFTVAILQTIPYFGPYVSWLPPVVVAFVYQPDAVVPVLIVMIIGMLVLANVIQPRVMGSAVGLSPLAVLVAVLIGGHVAGVLGAIFAVPIAAAGLATVHDLRARELGPPPPTAAETAALPADPPPV